MKKRSNLTNQNSFLRWKKSNLWDNFILEILANFFVFIFMVILIIVVRFLLEPFDLSLCWYNWWKHGSIIVLFIYFFINYQLCWLVVAEDKFICLIGFFFKSIFVFNYRLPALFVVAAKDKWGIALACYCHQRRRLYLQTNNGPIENHYFANKQEHSRMNVSPVIKQSS